MLYVKGKKGADLLRAYRETETASFHYKWELIENIEKFTHDNIDDYGLTFDVFLNDSGKYIVFHLYSIPSVHARFSDEFIKRFCKEFQVTFESVTREISTDYEGYEHEGLVTYLFEIIK